MLIPISRRRQGFAPELETSGPAVRAAATYEAGSHARRTRGWHAPTTTPNSALLANLTTLRDRSRQATRNDGYAKNAIDVKVANIVGTGVTPLSKADDREIRREINARFLQWTDESDADGDLEFYGQQSQAVRAWQEAGECFVRLRPRLASDGLSVPLQLQVLDAEMCPHTLTMTARNGNRVKAGIELNGIGRRVAYYFYPSRSNEPDDVGAGDLKRVPADSVIHLFEPLRPGQLRGEPTLTRALVKFHHLDKFDDAVLLRQELGNLVVAYITTPDLAPGAKTQLNPITGRPLESGEDKPTLEMNPGTYQALDPGEKIEWSKPPETGSAYPDFMRVQLYGAAVAAGVPYELLTGDLARVNDRQVRVILQEFRRRVLVQQHQILAFQFCRAVWNAWMDQVAISGILPIPIEYFANPEPWRRVVWQPHGFPYIHPLQDQQAAELSMRDGTTSREAVCAERGEDVEAIDEANAEAAKRTDELGLKYDSDGRFAKNAAAAAPAPTEDPEKPEPVGAGK